MIFKSFLASFIFFCYFIKTFLAHRCKFYLDVDQLHDFVQKVKADWRAAIPWYPLVPTAHKVMKNGDFDENSVKSYSLQIFIAN